MKLAKKQRKILADISEEPYDKKTRIKPKLSYIKKASTLLKKAIEEIKDTCTRLEEIGEWENENSIKARVLKRTLSQALKKLDRAVSMYFKIDFIREDYSPAQREALGKLKRTWHLINFNLPPYQWDFIKEIIAENKLEHAKILIRFGSMEQSFGQYTGKRYR